MGRDFIRILNEYFSKAVEITGDFEPIFFSGIYDMVPLPDDDFVLEEVNAFIEEMGRYRLEEIEADVVGFIYETLIPEEERHRLRQFYTPPQIAELIAKWAIRSLDDKVLDPACGSGTFLIKAYRVLRELNAKIMRKGAPVHKQILKQLYAFDINPFPAHLTAMNLAMRDIRYPTHEMNTIVEDFFKISPKQTILTPYTIRTPKGEVKREILIPQVDAIVANPPYTRWVEIPEGTKKAIVEIIGEKLKRYGLVGGIGNETGIYVHFIMHGYEFLRENGRLGMIISNSWLQADYGINFGSFLLDHSKIKAVIDFNQRLFRIPLIATCVLLLEKEGEC